MKSKLLTLTQITASAVTIKTVLRNSIALFLLILISHSSYGQILAWDFASALGSEASVTSTSTATNLNSSTITRGAGLLASALANTYSSNDFTASGTAAQAITNNDYLQFTVSAASGYMVSLSTLDANFRRSGTGPNTFQYMYSLNGFSTAGANIGSPISYTLTTGNGDAQTQINLSGISALQNVLSGTVITIRLYGYGASATGGTFALGRPTTPTNDLAIGGTITAVSSSFTQLTSGIATSPLTAGLTNQAILGFSAVSTATPNLTAFNVVTSNPTSGVFTNLKLFRSTDNSYSTAGDNTQVTGAIFNQTSGQIQVSGISEALSSTAKNYFIVADVSSNVDGNTPSVMPSLSNTNITVSSGIVNAFSLNGLNYLFIANGTPSIAASALTPFVSACLTSVAGPNSFIITGTLLTSADITVGALSGFAYSTSAGGPFVNSLTLSQPGGSYSQTIYVTFNPTLVQSYGGTGSNGIPVGGGGVGNIYVDATGTGINTAPTVTTGGAVATNGFSATLSGTVPSIGCSALIAYGFEYSNTNNFTPGTGFVAPSVAQLVGQNFSFLVNGNGWAGNTTHYYRAYATNNGGTVYGAQQSFIYNCPLPTITASGSTSICTGNSVTLNASTGSSYLWSTGETTQSITVSSAGSFTVNVNDGAQCSATSLPTAVSVTGFVMANSVFSENLGVPGGTTSIAAYSGWQNNGAYTFTSGGATNPADVRATTLSTGYTGASGGGNVWFTTTNADYGFAIEGVNALAYSALNLQFGYHKESASQLPALALSYWNGSAWVNVPYSFNEAANASVAWYLSPVITLPSGAQINGLKLRWVKSGAIAVRIDDIKLNGVSTSASITASGSTILCSGNSVTLTASPAVGYLWSTGATSQSIVVNSTGIYSVTNTGSNGCTISSTGVAVTVNTAPVITSTPSNVNVNNDAGTCGAMVTYSAASASGSPAPIITYSQNSGTVFNSGINTVTVTATNSCGTVTSTFTVTVHDIEQPSIGTNQDITQGNDAGACGAVVTFTAPTATDNCIGTSVVCTPSSGSTFAIGTTTVTCVATDANSNTSSSTFLITINDTELPTITAPIDITSCDGSNIVLGNAVASDNCPNITITNNAPSSFSVGTSVVTWTVTDAANNVATATQNVIITAPPVGSASNIVICNGDPTNLPLNSTVSGTTFTWTSAVTVGGVIGMTDCTFGCGNSITDILTNTGSVHGVVDYTVTPTAPGGCVGVPFVVSVTVGAAPAAPVIQGPAVVCGLTTAIYSCVAVPEATNYVWTVPTGVTGMTITSGQGTNLIHVTISAGTVSGSVTCTATNSCGSSPTTAMAVTKKPFAPAAIIGPSSVCGQTIATYSVASVFGATSYNWTVPAGMVITNSNGSMQITVSIATNFVSGLVKVSAVNACGNVPGTNLMVYGNVPPTPGTISGPTSVCGLTSATYTIPAVAGATGYLWTITGSGAISGSNTGLSVNVILNGTTAGVISCAATNLCGTGTARNLNLTTTPPQPGVISGPSVVCGYTSATYFISNVPGALSYNWSFPTNFITSIIPNGDSVTINFSSNFSNGMSGVLAVTITTACGTGLPRNLIVSQTQMPAAITGSTVTTVNGTTVSLVAGLTSATYFVPQISNALYYDWQIVGPNANTMNIASGQGTSSVVVHFNGTSGNYSGTATLKVAAVYSCLDRATNTSGYKTLPISGSALNPNDMNTNTIFSELYPNPFASEFVVDITSEIDRTLLLEVYDMLGKRIVSENRNISSGQSTIITNVENLEKGMYFIKLLDNDSNTLYSQRIIKQ